jgi:hypothetical protein
MTFSPLDIHSNYPSRGQYDNPYKDFTHNNFTYNINECDIKYMFFYFMLEVKSFISKISCK